MYVTGARENYELEPDALNQTKTNLMVGLFILLTEAGFTPKPLPSTSAFHSRLRFRTV